MTESSLRLFVAIELPDVWLQGLADLQERMRAALANDPATASLKLRWTRPEGIHLTLKFIGNIPVGRLEAIEQQLAAAVTEPPDIELRLVGSGTFTDRRAPRVVWAAIDSPQRQQLYQLAERIESWLAAAAVPRERRSFAPHLTLARMPESLNDDQRRRAAALTTTVSVPGLPSFQVQQVSLMRSLLGPGGARYEKLAAWPSAFTGR